jgi:predicted MFS family arabinose efflux permease
MQLTAVFGALLAIVAFLLPNTPPSREAKDPWAFLKAFALFKMVPGFAVFMLISFFISTEFQFYYVLSGPFMEQGLGIKHELISLFKSIAQYAEIICLGVFTPLSLKYLGLRKTLVIGALAWPLRYFIFALQKPVWLVLLSMSFHGIGYAFVFVTSFIYIDRIAPKDIRASAQSLFTLVSLGLGNWLGTLFSGWLKDHYTTFVADPKHPGQMIPGTVDWPMIFLIPALLTTVCGLAFWFTFREPAGDTEPLSDAELGTARA